MSPVGARVPEGVSELRKGMHYEEVQRILGARDEVFTDVGAVPGLPRVDIFTYFDDGILKQI
jgi:hypothetical protein